MQDITNTILLKSLFNNRFKVNDGFGNISKANTILEKDSIFTCAYKLDVNTYFSNIRLENSKIQIETKNPFGTNNLAEISKNLERYIQAKTDLATADSRPNFPELKVHKSIVANLVNFGLKVEDYICIEKYIDLHKSAVEKADKSIHIKRGTEQLPRSLVYMSSGPRRGWHVLLKTHGGVKEVGVGGFNRVTLTIHLNTGMKKAFRSTGVFYVLPSEIRVNALLENIRPDLFATGTHVYYEGPFRRRNGRVAGDENAFKESRKMKVSKIGMIMDYYEKSDLNTQYDNLDFKQKVYAMAKVAEQLAIMHKLGLTHRDIKTTNLLLDGKFNPKITDFGMACNTGVPVEPFATSGHESPEILIAQVGGKKYSACPGDDNWSFGVTMLTAFSGDIWYENWVKLPLNPIEKWRSLPFLTWSVLDDLIKDPNFNNHTGEVVRVISRCLTFDAGKRLTSAEAAHKLYKIFNSLSLDTDRWKTAANRIKDS